MRARRPWMTVAAFAAAAALAWGALRLVVLDGARAAATAAEAEAARLAATAADPADEADEVSRVEQQLALVRARVAARWSRLAFAAGDGGSGEVLHRLRALAAREGLDVLRFAPEAEYRLDRFLARAVSLSLEGSFFDLLAFIERVGALPGLVLIEDVEIEAQPGEQRRLRVQLTATAVRAEGRPFPEGKGGEAPPDTP